MKEIKRKQSAKNEDFKEVFAGIEQYITREAAQKLVDDTVSEIQRTCEGKRVAYAWSGGKDSLALQVVCSLAGISQSVLCTASKLEYPAFLAWCDEHAPKGLTVIDNEKLDLAWLQKHPQMLFPEQSRYSSEWFKAIQHRGQRIFFKEQKLDIIILGRRLQDGNYVGKGGENIYTDSKGVTRYSPLSKWKHTDILGVIHYFLNDSLPPIYSYPNGWVNGTGVWPARKPLQTINQTWEEIYAIDSNILTLAAEYIPSAKEFLTLKNQAK